MQEGGREQVPSRLLFSITLDPKHISPQRMEEGAGAFRPLTIASEKNEGLQPRRTFRVPMQSLSARMLIAIAQHTRREQGPSGP